MTNERKSSTAAVATSHPEAASAGAEVLRAGGNAVDAAVAAICTLCVVSPMSVGLGGYGGTMIAYIAKQKRVVAIDFDSRAPLAYRDELYADPESRRYSWKAVTAPGVVAGLDLALKEFGTKTWKEVAARALKFAEEGYPVEKKACRQLEEWLVRTEPDAVKSLFPSGNLPEPGDVWVQKDHARVIRRIMDEGAGAMYRGEIPREIVRQVQANGGVLSEEDFARYEPTIEEPLRIRYRGCELLTPPPPSGGITSLQTLKILEQFDFAKLEQWGAEHVHLIAESLKRCWGDRQQYLGDPQVVDVPMEMLLSTDRAARLADDVRKGGVANITGRSDSGPHTVNVVTRDDQGNLVSMTATLGYLFGSQRIAAGLGLVLGHGMSRFDYAPGHPNAPAPWKRMHHNMSPMIVLKDGQPHAAFGMPGGTKIVSVTAQLAMNLIDWNLSPGEAVRALRVHTEGADPIFITTSIDKRAVEELEAMGHQLRREQVIGGPANMLRVDGGEISAASGNGIECVAVLSPLPPGEG